MNWIHLGAHKTNNSSLISPIVPIFAFPYQAHFFLPFLSIISAIFPIMMFPSRNITFARSVSSRGRSHLSQLVSTSFDFDSDANDLLANTFRRQVNPTLRDNILFDSDNVIQFLCVHEGKFKLFSDPCVTLGDDSAPLMIGSLSDQLGHAVPVSMTRTYFDSNFVTLAPQSTVQALNLPHSPQMPDQINGPPLMDEEQGDDGSLARLQFEDGLSPQDLPVITAFPVTCPLPRGVHVPMDTPVAGLDITTIQSPHTRAGIQGVRYLFRMNRGASLNKADGLFNSALVASDVGINVTTVQDVNAPLQMLMTGHVNYTKVASRFDRMSEGIWFAKGMELMDALPDQNINPNAFGGHTDDAVSITNAIEKGLSARPLSQKDKELDRISAENQARLSIIFAGIAETHDPGSPSKTVLGVITSRGKEFYDCRLETAAARMLMKTSKANARNRKIPPTILIGLYL